MRVKLIGVSDEARKSESVARIKRGLSFLKRQVVSRLFLNSELCVAGRGLTLSRTLRIELSRDMLN